MTDFVDPIFSKPLYGKLLNINTKKIVSILEEYDFHNAGQNANENSVDNISLQSDNLYVLDDERFKFLKDELMKEFYSFATKVMKYSNEFKITTSWFTKTAKEQSSYYHNHNNCMISGVLYLQTNENSGDIIFGNFGNKRYKLKIDDYNLYNSTEWKIRPADGLLLMFPSEVHHKIQENKSDTTRYSLAFNLIPVGVIGDEKSDSHIA